MFVSHTVLSYLDRNAVDFELVPHRHALTASATARAAHINPDKLAKAVLLYDPEQYVLAIVPASKRVNPWAVSELVESSHLLLADEADLRYLFCDCECGALPAIGSAFGVRTVVDDRVLCNRDVYFEAGDHEHLIHMRGAEFALLMDGETHGSISC